jgi:predicted HicB family RNase H-like nuclease
MTILVPDELHKKLKVKAAQEGTSITEIVIEAVKEAI